MKLTIEHLAAYLPYGLKILRPDGKTKLTMVGIDGNHYVFEGTTYGTIGTKLNKPLLRPLSDITKEIEHNGERFVPMDWFEHHESIDYFDGNIWVKFLFAGESTELELIPYGVITKLLSWHFDIFGLIESGLAIPIKPIDNETTTM